MAMAKNRQGKKQSTPIQTVRIVMFGLGGVGKTSLIHRFLFGKFDSAYTATIEDDYRQVITYNNHIVDVTVLDTAGSYQFPAMRRHAIQNGQGFLLVYAIDNKQSIGEVGRIYAEITKEKGEEAKVPIIVVGNKLDKDHTGKRIVERNEVYELVNGWGRGVEHIETSAKLDQNVSLLFNKMIWIIDEARVEKKDLASVNCFSTTYDQTNADSESQNRSRSSTLDPSSAMKMKEWGSTRHPTTGRSYSVNPEELGRDIAEHNKNSIQYSSQLLTWQEDAEAVESNKMKKKRSSLRRIFSRKSVT